MLKEKKVYNLCLRDVLQSFSKYIHFQEPKTLVDSLQSPLWYNHNIKVGGVTICYKSWYDKDILLLNALFDKTVIFFFVRKNSRYLFLTN